MFSGWSSLVVVDVLGVASAVEVDVRFKNHATRRDSGTGLNVELRQEEVKCVPVQPDLLHYLEDHDSSL